MHFKLIISLTENSISDKIVEAAIAKGATSCTIVSSRTSGDIQIANTFIGNNLKPGLDVILLLAEEYLARDILESIEDLGGFDVNPDSGIAFCLDIEDAVGVAHQVTQFSENTEKKR